MEQSKRQLSSKHLPIVFFGGYAIIILAVIYFASTANIEIEGNKEKLTETFQVKIEETKKIQQEKVANSKPLWDIPNHIAATAMILASILDIVIILLWARNENKKREAQEAGVIPIKKRWTDSKWFWNIIAMGVVQPKDGRIRIIWRNMLLALALLTGVKYLVIDRL
ncbi:hypothetical protein LC085_11045 [Bacillus tianshenii]|uniref:hypothetical protein n=1 Tax=Sutcliffiella tianshenii TaxID=1463404 RepID=UPI001CD347B5|nr:hypothetical protein [Bacillus tianshenii]MCA1320446.1 hypothetical protein [Bacillus tianshenii]